MGPVPAELMFQKPEFKIFCSLLKYRRVHCATPNEVSGCIPEHCARASQGRKPIAIQRERVPMRKITTAVLAALMLTGILTAATANTTVTKKGGGPVPLCDPYADPTCRIK